MPAYVPGHQYDVFISYSHANNFEGWVDRFHEKLEARLNEKIPGVTVFRDTKSLEGNDELTPEVMAAVRSSAVFVAIVSTNYIGRSWCLKECGAFKETQKDQPDRIFAVRYDEIAPPEYRPLVGEKLGYVFFGKSPNAKNVDTFTTDSEAFKTEMNNLRIEIARKLQRLKAQQPTIPGIPGKGPERAKSTSVGTVFLAAPARGLQERANQITAWLNSYGFEVVRPCERFYDLDKYETRFKEDLGRSLIFVQVLGRNFDPHPDYHVGSWDQWQCLQAQAMKVPILKWFDKFEADGTKVDLEKLDATHHAFVKQDGTWDCDLQRFWEKVRMEVDLRFHNLRQQQRLTDNRASFPLVVLRSDPSDRTFAEEIGTNLKQLDCDWMRVPDKGIASLDDFAREFAANGMLIVFRACPDRWIISRLQELRKFLQTDLGRRWACGLWRAPDNDEDAVSCSVDGLFVIDPKDPGRLHEFVNLVQKTTLGI
jgi:hypothetical protein